jgi:hypothetical protein
MPRKVTIPLSTILALYARRFSRRNRDKIRAGAITHLATICHIDQKELDKCLKSGDYSILRKTDGKVDEIREQPDD